jgi:hypothetical protein
VEYPGYELAKRGRRAERDTLFVERCVEMLRPEGRLAIVLPHNKVAAQASTDLRRWLVEMARVYAVVSLPRETFLPHTSQKAVVVFAKRRLERAPSVARAGSERVFFAVSERAGKDAGGELVFRAGARDAGWRSVDHDLEAVGAPLTEFLQAEGFNGRAKTPRRPLRAASSFVVRTVAELGEAVTLAPERQRATRLTGDAGVLLSSLVEERIERVGEGDLHAAVVFDTTHAREGVLDLRAALRAIEPPSSSKKRVRAGDVLVSRLRPYLRQIAFVHPALAAECKGRPLVCSTEFYVLSANASGESLAFLVPWLLSEDTQAILAAAQEGGHHPRVPRETLFALRVPASKVEARGGVSTRVEDAIEGVFGARSALARLIEE